MKTTAYLFAILLYFLMQSACVLDDVFDCEHGRGGVIQETFDIDDAHTIQLRIDATVFLIQGDRREVTISGQPNIIDEIDFRIRNRELTIDNDRCLRNYDPVEIFITLPELRGLHISGSGKMITDGVWAVDDLQLTISGSGIMDLEVEGDDITGRISGSGDMRMQGLIDDLNFTISGSGNWSGFDMECRSATINISGSGSAEVTVTDFLDVRISGSGDVYYRGNPSIESRISGSGKLIDAN